MKKALGQTVRDIKREVNKKVLKVPSIEQKVLDATSNEPWGPHGSLLADIAQATRNYHEYQMIMLVIWKRINDTGKNWRHVYKALTVLDYLVAHGSERAIEDIREHSYQISTLSDFQYIDSNGKDEGNNVRKKSQSLVVLVNDKDRIEEIRQKAAANREKYRNTSTGNMYRPGSGSYDDRYESRDGRRDENRNDNGDSYGREGHWDDDYQGRSKSTDDYRYGSRSRSADRERAYDDGQYSSRKNGAKPDDHSQYGSTGLPRRYSEQNLSAPPSYEDAVRDNRSPTFSERDGESSLASAPKASSPTGSTSNHATVATDETSQKEVDGFDAFDPRGSFPAPATSDDAGMDLLGSLSESFSSNSLALVPLNELTVTPETNTPVNFSSGPTFAVSSSESINSNQPFDDPFGDGPFKAIPSGPSGAHPTTDPQFPQHEMSISSQDIDILADILPPSSSSFVITQISHPVPAGQSVSHFQPSIHTNYPRQSAESIQQTGFLGQSNSLTYPVQASVQAPFGGQSAQPNPNSNFYGAYNLQHSFISQSGSATSQIGPTAPQVQPSFSMAPVSSSIVPQPSKNKFETKSSVWADTLSRGLVDLNISGSKANPLANIGVDFDALNRKDKRMEKPAASITSTISMGKAMGSGSGMGRAGAGAMSAPQNPMVTSGNNFAMAGLNMGGGYGVSQPMGRGMGVNMPGNIGPMGQGVVNMQQQNRFLTGSNMRPGGYNNNPMMGSGNYGQQSYGGGHR